MASNDWFRCIQSTKFSGETRLSGVVSVCSQIVTNRSGSGTGRSRSSTRSTSAKIAPLAPTPIASVNTTMSVNALLLAQHARREAQILPQIREQLAARRAHGDGRRHVRLAQRPHAFGEIRVVAQLLAHERERRGLVEALVAKLGVALLEVLGKLLDDLRFAAGGEPQGSRAAPRSLASSWAWSDYSALSVSLGSIVAARRAGR